MSISHLKDLKTVLRDNHWLIVEELDGNDYEYSGYWKISRPNKTNTLTLAFDGMDDLITLPMERAFACSLIQNKEINLYFAKISKSWNSRLNLFIENLNAFDMQKSSY